MQELEAFIDNLPKDEQIIVKRLSNLQGVLSGGDRKQVRTIGVSSLLAIDEQLLREIFCDAILVDDQFIKNNQ